MKAKTVIKAAAMCVAVFAAGAFAAKTKNVAVVEAVVDANCDACKTIKKSDVGQITAELRRAAVVNLPLELYTVMTKETIQSQSEEVLQECASENCIIKMGDKIGADYIVKSGISKFGPVYTLTVEMYETKNGTLVAALPSTVESKDLYDILRKVAPVCGVMYKKFVSDRNPQYQPPAPAPAPAAPTYTLSFYVASGIGTVSLSPSQASYAYGARVTVAAGGAGGYVFKNWTGALAGSVNPAVIVMDGNKTVAAVFEPRGGGAEAVAPPAAVPDRVSSAKFTDSRDGKTYKSVVIGKKRWMGENLNYHPQSGESWCYDNDNANCGKYGRLYDRGTAASVCPSGWHLPSRGEWDDLGWAAGGERRVDGIGTVDWYGAGKKLKAKSGWSGNGNGTDGHGFSAMPGGYRSSDNSFRNAGGNGNWWAAGGDTDADDSGGSAYYRSMDGSGDRLGEYYDIVDGYGFSVRCVSDN